MSQALVHDLVNQARKLDLAGQHDAAIAHYRQALDREPNSYDAHYGIARALDLTGAYNEARDHFAKAIADAADGDKNQTQRMMGISWVFAGSLEGADGQFQEVFKRLLDERNFAAAAEEANELGRLHLEFGDLAGAEMWYRRGFGVAGRPTNRPQWQIDLAELRWAHAQARLASRRGQAREAHRQAALFDRLLAKGGNDDQKIQSPYLLGYLSFYLGAYGEAAKALASADQQDPAVLILRAQTAEKLGHPEEVRDYCRLVLQSNAHSINNAFARPLAQRMVSANRGR